MSTRVLGLFFIGGLPMKALLAAGLLLAFTSTFSAHPAAAQNKDEVAKMTLKVGDHAEDFTLLSDQWKTVKLSDFHGKKNVFLAVYVLAFTGG
jgi:cytochrome oxidase Cu insertion factor (SCO1/SenC/PrrC family)